MPSPTETDGLSREEIRAKALTGVVLVAARNIGVRLIGLGGTIVLARLLQPEDFGILALSLTIRTFGSVLASAGLGAALLRRATPPRREELEAVQGFQLTATVLVAVLVGIGGLVLGGAWTVAAITVLSLPIGTASGPTRIVLERDLNWALLARVETLSSVVYQTAAVVLVLVGLGVWGVAWAAVVEACVTLAVLLHFGPLGVTRPRLDFAPIRPLLGFGLQTQTFSLIATARDQGLNALVAAVGGLAVLGVWSVAFRLLSTVTLFLAALQRVAFPTLSRAIAAGDDPATIVNESMRLNAIALAVPAVLLAGTAPGFVPTFLGHKWDDAIPVMPFGAAAVLISAPVTSVGIAFLQAMGDGAAMIRVVASQTVAWLGLACVLLPIFGATGAGMSMVGGAIVLSSSVGRAAKRHADVRVVPAVLVVYVCACAGGAAGWTVASLLEAPALATAASAVAALGVFLGLLFAVRRDDLVHVFALLRRGLRPV